MSLDEVAEIPFQLEGIPVEIRETGRIDARS
jgi:hypothetical protein